MADLYVTPSFEVALEIGVKVFEYGTQDGAEFGPTGLHTVDAALELLQHVNALLREHKNLPLPKFDVAEPVSLEEAIEYVGKECKTAQSFKMGGGVDMGILVKLYNILKWFLKNSDLLNK